MPVVRINIGKPNERVIGILDPKNKIFKKSVLESKHLFRVYDAWGIDADYFTDVLLPNNYKIQVHEKEKGIVYEVTAEEFKKKAVYFHFKNKKEDHRSQIFLSRRHWRKLSKEDQKVRDFYLRYCV
ncbi:MAG: hypothetical protein ACTSR2_01085 [Candidatus Hodarchaeales archaeon]